MRAFRHCLVVCLFTGACASNAPLPPEPALCPRLEAGVNTHLDNDARLEEALALGARWIRVDVNWPALEPQPGVWDFRSLDPMLDKACELGLQVYASVITTPPWASSQGGGNAVPRSVAWRGFLRSLVRHSRGRIAVYGIWNEPNLPENWAGSVADYVDVLLRPAYQEVHAGDPQARVAGPDLAHLYSAPIDPLSFLKGLRRAGAAKCLDILSWHLYGGEDFQSKVTGFYAGKLLYRPGLEQMLQSSGWQGQELWVTELGVRSDDGGEELQVVRLAQQWLLLRSLGWVKKAFIYQLRDDQGGSEKWGLLRSDGSAKPAFLEMQRLILASEGAEAQ
jgi:hypothetical protein